MSRNLDIKIYLFICFVAVFILISCGDEIVQQLFHITNSEITLSVDKSFIKTGKSINLTVDVTGKNLGDYSYTYEILEGGGTITGTGANVVYTAGNIITNVRIMVIIANYTGKTNYSIFEFPVKDYQKISNTQGNFTGILNDGDRFGASVTSIGDLDNDGVMDIAVSTVGVAGAVGAVWIQFLNANGTVKSHQKISDTEGNFTGTLNNDDNFGYSVAMIGDLNNDGINDIAVGAIGDNGGGSNRGAVWILFMNANGTVKSHQKISNTEGNFTGILNDDNQLGTSIVNIGDLDNDGVMDIAVGANGDNDGGSYRGAVWILFLNANGTVKSHQKISDTEGNFTGILDDNDNFGISIANLGDLDNDGITDIVVGAIGDDDENVEGGAVWILFMNSNGTVKAYQKISSTAGNFTGVLDIGNYFGSSVANIGDLNNDGVMDIAVGANGDNDGGSYRGAVWILFLNANGTVK
ncbi:MAG: FG-GAP repeat protein, partial [Spirochaetes bacterium]|nr:FG-GAP repeat protein [Spirochaetota bacterium]